MLEIKPPSVTDGGDGGRRESSGKSHKVLGTWGGDGDVISVEKPSNLCSAHNCAIKSSHQTGALCAGNTAPHPPP